MCHCIKLYYNNNVLHCTTIINWVGLFTEEYLIVNYSYNTVIGPNSLMHGSHSQETKFSYRRIQQSPTERESKRYDSYSRLIQWCGNSVVHLRWDCRLAVCKTAAMMKVKGSKIMLTGLMLSGFEASWRQQAWQSRTVAISDGQCACSKAHLAI